MSRNVGTELPFHAASVDPNDIGTEARNQVSACLMPWLRRLVTGHLLRRTGFKLRSVHVGFVVGKVTDRFFSEYFGFPFRILMPWLRRLVTGHLLRRTGFELWPVHVGFVVGKVTDRFFSDYFGFPSGFYECSMLLFHLTPMLYSLLHLAASLNDTL